MAVCLKKTVYTHEEINISKSYTGKERLVKKWLLVNCRTRKEGGHTYLLSDELDKPVQLYLLQLRENGSAVNTNVTIACALGLVKHHDSNLLMCNGGYCIAGNFQGQYILLFSRMVPQPERLIP